MGPELVYALLLTPGSSWDTSQWMVFVALMGSVAVLSTARPFLTLVVLFSGPAASLLTADGGTAEAFFGLGLLGLLVIGEHHLRATEWAELFQSAFELQGLLGIAVVWVWFVVGATPEGMRFDLGPPVTALALAVPLLVGIAVHALVYRARARVWRLVRDVGMAGVGTAIETLLVGSIAGLLLLAPYVALGAAIVFVVPLLVAAATVRAVSRAVDRRHRAPCPACGALVRLEASRCPECHAVIEVRRVL